VVVILGGGPNGLGVVRSLARAGIRSVVVSTQHDEATVSRHCRKFLVSSFEGETFIAELLRLKTMMPDVNVVICADEHAVLTLSRHQDHLMPYFRFQVPSHELLQDMTHKFLFFQRAQQGGFPVPATVLLRCHGDLAALRDLRLPICVKPNSRLPSYDGSFQKAYRVTSVEEARSLCEQILEVTGEVVAQDWIEGPNDSIFFCLCCMGDPNPVAFAGRKGRSWPPQVGFTASCWAAPEVAEELEELTIRFFHRAGVTGGLASMEFKRDERDGRFFMVEPTLGRADMQEEIATLCGINLCHLAYCDAVGLPRPPLYLDPTHVWRNEFTDFWAAWALGTSCSYPSGYRIHNAYWRWDDPVPALLAALCYTKKMMLRIVGRWRTSISPMLTSP
jgi:D-aspartate ligase